MHISEMLKKSRGQYTDKQIKRCSQLGGEFGREFLRLLSENIALGHEASGQKPNNVYKQDITLAIKELHNDALFDYVPPRHYRAFATFTRTNRITAPQKTRTAPS